MQVTLREFVLLRIAADQAQATATAGSAWDDAVQRKIALAHRAALNTLSALVEAHQPGGVAGVNCPVCGPQPWGACRQTPECPPQKRFCDDCGQGWPCRTLRLVAATWREHTEFDEDWLHD